MSGAQDFVPHLAVNVAVVLAVLDIGVLVYFIHHISDSIQVSTLSGRVREELRATIMHLYPEAGTDAARRSEGGQPVTGAEVLPSGWRDASLPVYARDGGYVASIAAERLVTVAERHDVAVVLDRSPGDHVVDGDVIARVWASGDEAGPDRLSGLPESLPDEIRDAVVLGDTRSPHQDVRFAVLQLVEIAVRALSPGTNDPFTAVNALDDLSASLALMAGRGRPSPVRLGADGQVRLVAPSVAMEEIVVETFGYLRSYALGAPSVLDRALSLALTIGQRTDDPRVRRLLDTEVLALMQAFSDTGPPPRDADPLTERARAVRRHLMGPDRSDTGHEPGSPEPG